MAGKRSRIPKYGTVEINGHTYYRTNITDSEGKQRTLYAKTREELYDKELDTLSQMDDDRQRRKSPTVADYCEKWLVMQSAHVRTTTLTDYKSKVRRNIIPYLGDKKIAEVTLDDIQLALVPVSKKSASVYKSVIVIYKCIFRAAEESRIIKKNPTVYLSPKGGGVPQAEKQPLTDEQVQRLLDAVRGLPPYIFIMLGLYAGLRREEILGLQWDSVYLDSEAPYLAVRRAWHTEHNRPVVSPELKTAAAKRNIPLPDHLVACLREAKRNSTSDYVVANRDGGPLSYTQFKRLWQYVVTRTAKPRSARKLVDGKYVKYMLYPELGEKARNNGHVVYSLDFDVTPIYALLSARKKFLALFSCRFAPLRPTLISGKTGMPLPIHNAKKGRSIWQRKNKTYRHTAQLRSVVSPISVPGSLTPTANGFPFMLPPVRNYTRRSRTHGSRYRTSFFGGKTLP